MNNKLCKKIFSKEQKGIHDVYRILGVKFSFKNKEKVAQQKIILERDRASRIIQDTLDMSMLRKAKKVIVFLTPGRSYINGGVMSIYSLCKTSRELNPDAFCSVVTYPNDYTYVVNDKFKNNELILRFEQITENAKNAEEMIIHIPDFRAHRFYNDLKSNEIEFLKSIPHLQLNIMNQNIKLMPEPEKIKDLYLLTDNITQTIAHDRYATQEVCDKWGIPTHLFSVRIDMSAYKTYPFEEKEKIIVLSPDKNEYKERIVNKLKTELPDWELVTVNNMTFNEYMDLIARAYFTVTFGEGFDGYFLQPHVVSSIGFSVYNDEFFPNEDWKKYQNVYSSYEEMLNRIVADVKQLQGDKEAYLTLTKDIKAEHDKLYNYDKFRNNLRNFYNGNYDFLPKENA